MCMHRKDRAQALTGTVKVLGDSRAGGGGGTTLCIYIWPWDGGLGDIYGRRGGGGRGRDRDRELDISSSLISILETTRPRFVRGRVHLLQHDP